jgi:hypothetical protein
LPFCDLIATRDVLSGHHLAGLGVDVLLLQSVAGLPVDPIETDFFAERRGRTILLQTLEKRKIMT